MRLTHQLATVVAALLMATLTHAQESSPSWDSNSWAPMQDSMLQRRAADAEQKPAEVQGRNYAVNEPTYSNDTDINSVIEQLLTSRREGRNLGEYDQVYADGNIDQALMQGNDMMARNLIRDKLCGLGLMSCEVEEKRPFYSTIYAQGPPPSAGFGGGPYGPARPMPPPNHYNQRPPQSSLNSFGPPRKVGYESSYNKPNYRPTGPAPSYNGPFLESPPPSAIGGTGSTSFNKPPPGAVIYGSKPPGPIYMGNSDVPPYHFENPEKIQTAGSQQNNFYSQQTSAASSSAPSNFVVGNAAALSSAAAAAALQQHVHHHYHHVEGTDAVGAKVPTVPIPIGAGQNINTDFTSLAQSSTAFTPQTSGFTQSNAFNAGFNGASQGGLLTQGANGYKPNGDLYKPSGGFNSGNGAGFEQGLGTTGFGQNSFNQGGFEQNNFGQNGLGSQTPSGSYHSSNPDYFKKELHNFGGLSTSSNLNGISTGYGGASQYPAGYDTSRQQIVDCQCVPFDQCPAADRIGRKEDLILPIDPRNLGKDIEALSDEAAANITVSANNGNVKAETDADSKKTKHQSEPKKGDEEQKRSKRQTDDQADDAADLPIDAEGRQIGAPLQAFELIKRKILPTYGVSFGLPYPSGAYPVNALGELQPAQNPHFGSIGPNGLNLGLLNVNPLASVQVVKTEYGDKVVKPLVNLHITPNANILEKVGDLFKRKPKPQINNHYHHHEHFSGFEHGIEHEHHPHIHTSPGAIEHYGSLSAPGFTQIEMIPSKPIFEYHSNAHVQPISAPIHQHIHHENHQASFGENTFDSHHQVTGAQYYPTGSTGHYLAGPTGHSGNSFATTNAGFDHTSNGFEHSNHGYGHSNNGFGHGSTAPGGYTQYQSYASGAGSYGASGFDNANYERNANVSFFQAPIAAEQAHVQSKYEQYNEAGAGIRRGKQLASNGVHQIPTPAPGTHEGSAHVTFPKDRRRRNVENHEEVAREQGSVLARSIKQEQRAYYGNRPVEKTCRINEVCCRRPFRPPQQQQFGRCGTRNAAGITGRIKNPIYVDGDSEFGEYPWHVAILKKDPKESIYACGGTLIDAQHVITAAHCIKSQNGFDLRARLGEWDVNHDVEFFPYIERDVISVQIHPEYYAGTLANDLAVLKLDHPVDFTKNPHISPACLPDKFSDFTGARCWTTGWGKDAFGEHGKYQNILKEVDVPILPQQTCETQLRQTRLGYSYKLSPGFICAGGEEGKDACKGDGGGPLACERNGVWHVVGVVSWGIGCGKVNVPGVYVRVAHYLDWIRQITQYYK